MGGKRMSMSWENNEQKNYKEVESQPNQNFTWREGEHTY